MHAHPGPPKPVRRGRPKCCTTCAQWRSWPAGPIWTGRTKLVSTSNCRCSRSVAPANSQRASADAPPIRSFGAGGAATHGRWRSPVFAARHLAPCESAAAESGRRHQPAGIARTSLEEENRELRRQVERLRRPAGSSVFAADADGDIVEIERSRRARMWRRQIQVDARQLPCAASVEARVSRLMRMTRAVGVSQAKTRGLRGVNPFLSRFLGLSCFGGLTDFQKH